MKTDPLPPEENLRPISSVQSVESTIHAVVGELRQESTLFANHSSLLPHVAAQLEDLPSARATLLMIHTALNNLSVKFSSHQNDLVNAAAVAGWLLDDRATLTDERRDLRSLYQPIIERMHEAEELAEYYRQLLQDHNIKY